MKLTDLDAELFRYDVRRELKRKQPPEWKDRPIEEWAAAGYPVNQVWEDTDYMVPVTTVAEAQGIDFECPKCRGHHIVIAFRDRGVLDRQGTRDKQGNPTRWLVVSGTGVHDLTLDPSIDCTPSNPNCWHGFIKNGEIT